MPVGISRSIPTTTPNNTHWGALRVFNDDVIHAGQGFGMHPHRDMEIITCVLDGALEHQDSLGGKGVIRPGELQVMSAGTGIFHSERNHSTTEPLRPDADLDLSRA